jgi:chorismate mutase
LTDSELAYLSERRLEWIAKVARFREQARVAELRTRRREPRVGERPSGLVLLIHAGLVRGDEAKPELITEVRVEDPAAVLRGES